MDEIFAFLYARSFPRAERVIMSQIRMRRVRIYEIHNATSAGAFLVRTTTDRRIARRYCRRSIIRVAVTPSNVKYRLAHHSC